MKKVLREMKSSLKKGISFLAIIAMVLTCCNVREAKAESYLEPVGGIREVVLVLDVSGSMSGTPMTAMKAAAVNFCEQLMEAEGYNKVSVVTYGSSVSKVLDFTIELEEATTFINSLYASGGTNLYSGLSRAKQILDESPAVTAKKSIVLLTDGLPENGPTLSSGKYNGMGPSYSYKYGNYLYNYFNENLKEDYEVYSLGFFHSLSNSYIEYAETLLRDIQNKGYYEVIDPEDLVFKFGDVAEDIINTEESKCPIIIVPGVMGSQLYDQDLELVWVDYLRIANPLYRLDSKMEMSQYLKLKNYDFDSDGQQVPINQATLDAGNREYGAIGMYKDLVDGVIEEFTEDGVCSRNVYFFSYDFRKSNGDNSWELNCFISDVLKQNPEYSHVDIVAHSMGGLVVSDYVADWGSEKIRKVITCGTPYEGAPKLVNSVLTTEVIEGGIKNFALWSLGGLTKEVKASFPAIAELAPTERYFSENASLFKRYIGKEWTSPFSYKKVYKELSWLDYQTINSIVFGMEHMFDSKDFHKGILSEDGYNVLAGLDNSYFIVGINQKTISGITYEVGSDVDGTDVLDVTYETKGDGTVPYASSTMMKTLENLPDDRFFKISTTHAGVTGKSSEANAGVALGKILAILSDDINAPTTDELIEQGYIVIRIACPVDVTVEYDGEILCSDLNTLQRSTSYGVLDFLGEEMEIKTLCLEEHDDYNIVLNGTDDGTMDYTIRYYNKNDILEAEYEFSDIEITERTVIRTGTDRNNIRLSVDTDGDGNIDETLHPGFCDLNGELSKVNDNLIQYTCDEYQITYEVVSCYGSNYNVDVTITNRTDETIHNWILAYDSTDVITNIWNGASEGYEDYTLIKNVGYNQDIYPGESVSFGFVATKDEYIEMPSKFRVITEESEVQQAEYEVEFEIVSDWETGYNGRVTILNNSSNALSDWMLEFDFEDNIDNLWNGNIVSHENGKYIVRNATYNHNINPGESVSIEFTVSERVTDSEPKNYKLTTVN